MGASGIGQESAYTHKLPELPPGTSKRSPSLCTIQRKYTKSWDIKFWESNVHFSEIISKTQYTSHVYLRKNTSKTSFILKKLLYGHVHLVGLRRNSLATAPKIYTKYLQKHHRRTSFLYMIYHVNHVFFLQGNGTHINKSTIKINWPLKTVFNIFCNQGLSLS